MVGDKYKDYSVKTSIFDAKPCYETNYATRFPPLRVCCGGMCYHAHLDLR